MDNVPIIYIYLYGKIRKKVNGFLIPSWELKKCVERWIICDQTYGGSRKGVSKNYLWDIIKDMEDMGLIKKVDNSKYRILTHSCIKKLKKFIW